MLYYLYHIIVYRIILLDRSIGACVFDKLSQFTTRVVF